ncbi:MAG: hypothetical protein C0501_11900 [Isosphaera sp.]|nr:hypothetical protein [Isosphaera sp.]
MYVFLLSGLLALLVIDDRQTGQPGQGRPTGGADKASPSAPFDGNWTVVAAEMNGQPVAEAKNLSVTVRDNVVTFTGAGGATGATPGKMKALRLSFGPNSTVRVTEAGADGKFGGSGDDKGTRPGTGTTPPAGGTEKEKGTGTQPGGTAGSATQPGGTAGGATSHGTKSGVYILTQDYLALSVHEDSAGGTRPGGADPETRPGGQPGTGTTPPAGGTGTQPGGTGTTTQPGGTAGGQPGGAAGDDATRPNTKTYMTVILRRAGGDAPKRDKE